MKLKSKVKDYTIIIAIVVAIFDAIISAIVALVKNDEISHAMLSLFVTYPLIIGIILFAILLGVTFDWVEAGKPKTILRFLKSKLFEDATLYDKVEIFSIDSDGGAVILEVSNKDLVEQVADYIDKDRQRDDDKHKQIIVRNRYIAVEVDNIKRLPYLLEEINNKFNKTNER